MQLKLNFLPYEGLELSALEANYNVLRCLYSWAMKTIPVFSFGQMDYPVVFQFLSVLPISL